ncbi:pyridoxal-dependent decarboxylase [Tumidithrix helvetica PCC 7403]|uniref:pyridoxal phosphate-dependent decarboxylase family protein n=1 Tax=Tumidithrix helvetica TaxID=3457545 RepID=UPI003C87DFD2
MPNPSLDSQFLHPDRHNRETLRQLGYAFVDLITDAVLDRQDRAFVKDESPFQIEISSDGTTSTDLLLELRSQILPRALNLQNPRYMGHMDSVPLAITIWADALTAALNNNMLSQELAPVFTQLEAQLVTWFGKLFGLGDRAFGTLTAGGSLANITAMLLARNAKQPASQDLGVNYRTNHNLVAFVSDAAHTSFDKAMNVIGLGRENLIRVTTNDRGEIELEALESAVQQAIAQGKQPFFIAAIAGTTVTGAIDNIAAVGAIARQYDCWFHIDAAYGGAAMFSPQWKYLLNGCDAADSLTFNPQKWMWVSRTCAMLLVKQKQDLINGFKMELPYMADNSLNFGNINLQGTRRTDSLKLWLALRSLGLNGYAELIDRSMSNAIALRQWIDASEEVELVCEPTINLVCFQSSNPALSSASLRQKWINAEKLWLSLPLWKGDRILKAVVLHPHATW